jgi:hypothetical protein
MVIEQHGKKFEIYGYPIIEGEITKAYATDELNDVYLLIWRTGVEPKQGNVSIVRIEKPTR